jgi:hypothetical protein
MGKRKDDDEDRRSKTWIGELRERSEEYLANVRNFEGSAFEMARLIARNRAIALVKGCCGHHGEPGC